MTNQGYTYIGLITDRTGSMGIRTPGGTRAGDATTGIRALLAEQAALPGELRVSLTEFDSPAVLTLADVWEAESARSDASAASCHRVGEPEAAIGLEYRAQALTEAAEELRAAVAAALAGEGESGG